MIDPRLTADVKVAEGLKLVAYKDTEGFWTVGYGHELQPTTKDWTGYAITQMQAEGLLILDLENAKHDAQKCPEWPVLNDCRQNAVTELVFNLGFDKWMRFRKCRLALLNQRWKEAEAELLNSDWRTEVGPTRSERLGRYLRLGSYLRLVAGSSSSPPSASDSAPTPSAPTS